MDHPNYSQFYNLDGYLFNTVAPRFHAQGFLSAFDFFCIVIWKANRAKSKIARRLLAHSPGCFMEQAVCELTSGIFLQPDAETRMRYLWCDCGIRLPMASAILTVLYPEEFTVYDYRVCDCMGKFHEIGVTSRFDKLWSNYTEFCQAVKNATPKGLSLRDKDRYLWGKSFAEQLDHDLINGFRRDTADE